MLQSFQNLLFASGKGEEENCQIVNKNLLIFIFELFSLPHFAELICLFTIPSFNRANRHGKVAFVDWQGAKFIPVI